MAKTNLELMLVQCAKPLPEGSSDDLINAQRKSEYDVIHELVRQVTSPNTLVREQVPLIFIFLFVQHYDQGFTFFHAYLVRFEQTVMDYVLECWPYSFTCIFCALQWLILHNMTNIFRFFFIILQRPCTRSRWLRKLWGKL